MALSAKLKGIRCVRSRSRARSEHGRARKFCPPAGNVLFITALVLLATSPLPFFASAQETTGAPTEEIVVNLSAGRVVIAVLKDAILIGTMETPIEQQTHVPTPVQLSSERAGIILGAVDWFS